MSASLYRRYRVRRHLRAQLAHLETVQVRARVRRTLALIP